jgi:moderate conductance mechanosensitive channel
MASSGCWSALLRWSAFNLAMGLSSAARDWTLTHGLRVLVVLIAVLAVRALLVRTIGPAFRRSLVRSISEEGRAEELKRAETLSQVASTTLVAAVLLIGVFLILAELGFTLAPALAGLGITGIAVGLGAQTLVKDAINGTLILAENQFRRGDMVTIAGVTGRVVDLGLRRTVLRAEDGTLFSVPNSSIAVAANHTRGYSGISFEVRLPYAADIDRAIAEVGRIGREVAQDPEYHQLILEPPQALRVDALEDTYLNLRVSGRVAPTPGAQAAVAGEMRKRIKQEFERLGIAYQGGPAEGSNPS